MRGVLVLALLYVTHITMRGGLLFERAMFGANVRGLAKLNSTAYPYI